MLAVSALASHYGRIRALDGIDLEVGEGELVALVGANGAGKSTLLRVLSGLQPASAGRVRFLGEDITREAAERRVRRGIVQVPEGRQVFGPLSVEDNLLLGGYACPGARRGADLERVYEMFPVLRERRAQAAGLLSGGQQQMLAISRAMLSRPKLMLMDEPSLGLSPLLTQEIFRIIARINREQGTTILLVEQNANMALEVAEFGYVLEVGRIVMEDTCANLARKEDVQEFYLGMKSEGVRGQRRWKKKKQWR